MDPPPRPTRRGTRCVEAGAWDAARARGNSRGAPCDAPARRCVGGRGPSPRSPALPGPSRPLHRPPVDPLDASWGPPQIDQREKRGGGSGPPLVLCADGLCQSDAGDPPLHRGVGATRGSPGAHRPTAALRPMPRKRGGVRRPQRTPPAPGAWAPPPQRAPSLPPPPVPPPPCPPPPPKTHGTGAPEGRALPRRRAGHTKGLGPVQCSSPN